MESANDHARCESGIYPRANDVELRVALARIEMLDQRLAADVGAAQAMNPAVGLVLACLRLQLLVAAERLLLMVSHDAEDPDAVVTARALIVAYKTAITDASSAVIRVSLLPRAA